MTTLASPLPRIAALLMLAVVSGCAVAPRPLRGEFSPLTPNEASATGAVSEHVRWGGDIIAVTPGAERTCFEILARPLSDTARPRMTDTSLGRFLACRAGFYDPALFHADRQLTVVGTLSGYETKPIGEYAYRYPKVDAEAIFLWPEPNMAEVYYAAPAGWHPSYYPWGWGPYVWRPYRVYYRERVAPTPQTAQPPSR